MDIDEKKKPSGPEKKKGDLPPRQAAEQERELGEREVRRSEERGERFGSPEPGQEEREAIDEGGAQTK